PFETGVVRAIHVRDGETVKAGDVLVELDTTINAAERDRLAKEMLAARLDVARLRAALGASGDGTVLFAPPDGASAQQIELQRTLLASQLDEYRAKLANLDRQIAQNEANRLAVAGAVDKLTLSIPLLRQRVDARKYLADMGYGSRLTYLELQQDLVEHEQELHVQKAHLTQAGAALPGAGEQRPPAPGGVS